MAHCHRFGRVEVRPTERLLLLDGQPATLGARAFDLLLALIEHRDRLVTKNELLDLVWPGLVVEENNLQVQVSTLRKLLGPQAIATIPGRGYRLALRMDDEPASPAAPASAAPACVSIRPALPLPSTPLLGRDDDLMALDELLQHNRLVTVIGPGGIGKTVLALAAAHARQAAQRDGVAWVKLADLRDASLLGSAVAQAAGLSTSASADPLPSLVAALQPLQLLVCIDNAEHLLDEVLRLVRAIIAGAPRVRLLVTSQVALKLDGERVFRLGALSVPDAGTPPAEALAHGAVALFADQARAADRRFVLTADNVDTVVALCRELDGLPLAIKLAAARLPLLGLPGLAARLGDRLRLLGGGQRDAPTRQQTLCAALDWSHGLLGAAEQTVFRRLGVFDGGFTLELAAQVAGNEALDEWAVVDALGALVDRSLVVLDKTEPLRYRLPESAREYARLQLDAAGDRHAVQARHAQAVAMLMDRAYESIWTLPDEHWLAAHGDEIDNLRAACDWAAAHDTRLAVRLIGSSSFMFLLLGLAPEGRRRFELLDAAVDAGDRSPVAARYWLERSRLHWGVSNTLMREQALKAVDAYRAAGDMRGLYLGLRCAAGSGAVTATQAWPMLDEMAALERPDWPPRLRAQRLLAQVTVLRAEGRLAEVRSTLEAVRTLAVSAGLDTIAAAALSGLGGANLSLRDPEQALRCSRELIDRRGRRDNFILHAHATEAQALLTLGLPVQARTALAEFAAASRSRDWEWFGLYADLFALQAACEGRAEAAARLIGHADAASRQVGSRDGNMAAAREQAIAAVAAALAPATIARLMAEGGCMDREAVCALALAGAPSS